MTEFDIQDSLFKKFCELDDFARENGYNGEPFLIKEEIDGETVYKNVHFPNETFAKPETATPEGSWFDLTFRSNEPHSAALGGESQNRYTGVLYIDIYTPLDCGEGEARNKYEWIAKLFSRDLYFDDVVIMKTYISTKGNNAVSYRLQAAVEWTADIDKE